MFSHPKVRGIIVIEVSKFLMVHLKHMFVCMYACVCVYVCVCACACACVCACVRVRA